MLGVLAHLDESNVNEEKKVTSRGSLPGVTVVAAGTASETEILLVDGNGGLSVSSASKSHGFLQKDAIDEPTLKAIKALAAIAEQRGQSLAQMALAWVLRHPQMSSVIIGASRVSQIDDNLKALKHLEFTPEELTGIDEICRVRLAEQAK